MGLVVGNFDHLARLRASPKGCGDHKRKAFLPSAFEEIGIFPSSERACNAVETREERSDFQEEGQALPGSGKQMQTILLM